MGELEYLHTLPAFHAMGSRNTFCSSCYRQSLWHSYMWVAMITSSVYIRTILDVSLSCHAAVKRQNTSHCLFPYMYVRREIVEVN